VIARAAAAAVRSARLRPALLAGGAGALLLGLAPGGLGPAAARAALAVACLGAAVAIMRRRAGSASTADAPLLRVLARAPLSRDTGVALVELEGRRLLVGFGAGGVRVLAPARDGEMPP
jgi:flagellar protein FliO/FliZ